MSHVIVPQRRAWTRQPPAGFGLDESFWDYSVYAYNFNGDAPRNLAKKSHGKPLSKGTALFKGVEGGIGLFSTADASTRAYGDSSVTDPIITSDVAGTGDFSIAFVIKPVANATRRVLFHQFNDGGTKQIYLVVNGYLGQGSGAFTDQSGTLWVGVFDAAGAQGRGVYITGVVDGSTLHGVFNRYASGRNELWLNGRLAGVYESASIADCYGGVGTSIGFNGRTDQSGYSSNVSCIQSIYAANRKLTHAESAWISANHWNLYAHRDRRTIVALGGGSGTTITATLAEADASAFQANVDLQRAISASLASVAASGFSANIDLQRSVLATRGDAAAVGHSANVNLVQAITAALGAAAASGYDATIELAGALNVPASLGVASATGHTANVNLVYALNATTGTATAVGFDATLDSESPPFTQAELDYLLAYMQENLVFPPGGTIYLRRR